MSVIKINCVDQVLHLANAPVIASGGIREDHVEFTFCSQWDGFEKVAIFVKNTEMLPPQLIDLNGRCEIPYDVLASAGRFYIGVLGVNAAGFRRTTELLEYKIVEGAVDSVGPLPGPTVYEQILAAMAERVPNTRKVNGKALTSDITLAAENFTLYENITAGVLSGTDINDYSVALRRVLFADAFFFRMYFKFEWQMTAGEEYDVCTFPKEYAPAARHALACSAIPDCSAVVTADGVVKLRPKTDVGAGYSFYISGFWMK
jgi:hypothetical protein